MAIPKGADPAHRKKFLNGKKFQIYIFWTVIQPHKATVFSFFLVDKIHYRN